MIYLIMMNKIYLSVNKHIKYIPGYNLILKCKREKPVLRKQVYKSIENLRWVNIYINGLISYTFL